MTLAGTGADLLSVNEAYRFRDLLANVPGYQTVQPGTGFLLNNGVLVRDGIKVTGFEARQMCDAVGTSPPRSATLVTFEHGGLKRAHISTHLNAHIQSGGLPTDLPRTREAIRHMIRLEAWVTELRTADYRVTVAGDFNWAWSAADDHDWTYSPEAVFVRLGMVSQFDAPSTVGGTLGRRGIDYLLFDPADLTLTSQRIIEGEHSDHRWVEVQYETRRPSPGLLPQVRGASVPTLPPDADERRSLNHAQGESWTRSART